MGANGYAKNVLVSTDWVADHLGDERVVVAEVDENPDLYDEGHIPGAVKLHWRDDLQDPVERDIVDKESFERAARLARHRQRHHGHPLRRPQQLVRRLRLLVPQGLRARGRADRRRRPAEVVRRGARAQHRDAGARRATYTADDRDESIRAYRDYVREASATRTRRSSTSARRRSTRASCSPRPATSRRAPRAAGTSRARSRSRGRRR